MTWVTRVEWHARVFANLDASTEGLLYDYVERNASIRACVVTKEMLPSRHPLKREPTLRRIRRSSSQLVRGAGYDRKSPTSNR